VTLGVAIAIILLLGLAGFFLGSWRARASAKEGERLHSRPHYSGIFVLLWTMLPAVFLILIWSMGEPAVISRLVQANMPAEAQASSSSARALMMSTIDMLDSGLKALTPEEIVTVREGRGNLKELLAGKGVPLASEPEPQIVEAALYKDALERSSRLILVISALLLAAIGFIGSLLQIRAQFRSRNAVERVALAGLIAASMVAILTTVGIILSMLFETLHFFHQVSPSNFFFGTVWDPRFSAAGSSGGGEGQFGLLPLLWGTMYISFVALLVAVPIGLFSAIYMSEYASSRVRVSAKPILEILAGIPTIVYGFFALVTFGPFLRDLGLHIGLNISASSVLTAGLIMGVMLIPFVSSLSDDIINAVPQSLREGSYGLGATQSETIKRVVLPAALPGIVGAVLLAASRAIGETMIVVLAAGIAANLTLNAFEPVTTITVKIVSQLTGDLEFNSPQTLVAFALGLTLFVFTLALNVYALYIVRKYREQYE
jgi:phosphate transport system permease protein